jgi:hypothetical protein
VRYRIVIAAMIPAPAHGSSSSTTAAVTNGLRASPVRSTLSLSGMMSTNSNEKSEYRSSRQDSWNLNPRRTVSGGLPVTGMPSLSPRFLGVVSCTAIWDLSVASQKARSFVGLPLRQEVSRFVSLNGFFFLSHHHLCFSTSHNMIATHPFEAARESVLPFVVASCASTMLGT